MRNLKGLLFISLLFFPLELEATTVVTGKIQTLGTANIINGAFVRLWLRGCGGNQPRVNGTAIIGPSQGGVFFVDLAADSNGNVSGTIYSTRDAAGTGNGDIECGSSKQAVWYGMQIFVAGKGGPEIPVHAKNTGTLDITQVTPITTNPVITSPTGDSTYLRLDAGNSPLTGNLSSTGTISDAGGSHTGTETFSGPAIISKLDGIIWLDGTTYTTLAACYAAIPSTGGTCVVPPNYSETLAANLVMSKNGAGFLFYCPAAITMGTFQITKASSVSGAFIKGISAFGGGSVAAGANQCAFNYTGTGHAFDIGDTSAQTVGFDIENLTITVTDTAATALYMTRVQRYQESGLVLRGPGGAVNSIGMALDGASVFTGDNINSTIPVCSGLLTCVKFVTAANSNTFSGGNQTAGATGDIAIDFEGSSTGNIIINFDVETSATAVKFGGTANNNYVSIWHSFNTTDFLFGATSSNNTGVAIGPTSRVPIVSDSGTNNSVPWAPKYKQDASGNLSIAGAIAIGTASGSIFSQVQQASATGCTTAASQNATCTTTVTWTAPFADTGYKAVCNGFGVAAGVPLLQQVGTTVAASVSPVTLANSAVAAQFNNISCLGWHP